MRFHLLNNCFLKTEVIDCLFTTSGDSTAIDNTEPVLDIIKVSRISTFATEDFNSSLSDLWQRVPWV